MMRYTQPLRILLLLTLSLPATSFANPIAIKDVSHIARAISLVQPRRPEGKYIEYAIGIYKAARRFNIDPAILISIAQQETSFRELPGEGRAGELGICQVLKRWARNPSFVAEFGRVSRGDFQKPANSFLFAAWILKSLREERAKSALPYWSYYNARRFENRFRYYLSVSRFISTLQRFEEDFRGMTLALFDGKRQQQPVSPDLRQRSISSLGTNSSWTPRPVPKKIKAKISDTQKEVLSSWIPSEIRRIQDHKSQQVAKHSKRQLIVNASVGSSVLEVFFKNPVRD